MKKLLFALLYTPLLFAQTNIEINVIGQPIVGETITIEVTATHSDGINKIVLIQDDDYVNGKTVKYCNGATSCTLTHNISLDYIGSIELKAYLWGLPNTYLTDTSTTINFSCNSEYCSPDPTINAFFRWMRNSGYDECLIERYYSYVVIPELKARMKAFISKKPIGYNQTDTIIFYDIIPTDNQATYTGMDIGEAPNCNPFFSYPEFCPNPTSADYTFLENLWKTVFGIDFNFQYERMEVSYEDEFGSPTWSNGKWVFTIPNSFYINNIQPHNIAHFAIDTWNNKLVKNANGGKSSAQLFIEPLGWGDLGIYTHEWGHSQGLLHSFVDINGTRTFLTPDGIMCNTYQVGTGLFDPLDPLERYIFEPIDGYLDQETFADKYNQGIIASYQFNNICGNIDPAVTSFSLTNTTATEYIFTATLNNFGNIDASFVELSLFQGDVNNTPLIERVYEVLEPNTPFTINITIDKNDITESDLYIKIDPLNLILDEDETNNTLSITEGLGILKNELLNSLINIYPNPVGDILNIEVYGNFAYHIKIFTIDGKLISKHVNDSTIDTSNLPNGIYFLEITAINTGQRAFKKVIVRK